MLLRELHIKSRRVTEECCLILQDIEMTGVVESRKHNYIHPEILFLMEMRALRPIDFVIRIARLECAVFPPLSFLWSIILSVVISLQGGGVVGVLARRAASCSCCWFEAEHIGPNTDS